MVTVTGSGLATKREENMAMDQCNPTLALVDVAPSAESGSRN